MTNRVAIAGLVIATVGGALLAFLVPGNDRPSRSPRHRHLDAGETAPGPSGTPTPRVAADPDRSGAAGGELVVEPDPVVAAVKADPVVSIRRAEDTVAEKSLTEGPFEVKYDRDEADDRPFTIEINSERHKPYKAPLPTRNEDLGRIVLRPGLFYGGRLVDASDRPVEGAVVQIRDFLGNVTATAPASGPDGRFRCGLSASQVRLGTDEQGNLIDVRIAPVRAGVSYAQVLGRMEGFAGDHRVRIEEEGSLRLRFVMRGGAAVAHGEVALWRDSWEQTTQLDRGRTGEDGIYEARWPATSESARVRIVTAEVSRDFLVRRRTALAANPLTLVVDMSKFLRLRVVHAASRRPAPRSRITANLLVWPERESQSRYDRSIRASNLPKDNPALSAWPRGETDADGRIQWEFGESPDADPRTLRLNGVQITYMGEDGFPAQEDFDLKSGEVGVPVEGERTLRVGTNPDGHRDIWIRCQDTKGAELTPARVVIDTVADDRPWSVGSARVIGDPFYDANGRRIWRLRGVRFESSTMTDKARGTIVRVEAEERGIERFEVPIAAWQAASAARHALLFEFQDPDVRDSVVQVVDMAGKPQSGAVVSWMPYDGKSPYDWTYELGSATADSEGRVPMGHLASGFPYRVFAFDPRTMAAGRLDDYRIETSSGTTRLRVSPAQPLGVRVRVPAGARLVAAGMVTRPRLMLPDVACRVSEDGWVRADPAALECYELGIGVMFGQRRVGKTFAASEVQGKEIEFPDDAK